MGKRKSKAPPPTKEIKKVPTTFDCPFCNHESSITCRLDRVADVGEVSCRICGEKFQTTIDNLSEPVDVYSEWIDECERVNKGDD
mmetsp:Transcript_26945/g.32707  ORF Transcript_26945/g.32707 Transcript_26945/m.32707 type:complete len:85 (-) Transcript_26945:536-790(-)|eukprot:CAMPEP_0197844326 /NCGR_PEP_ID=MMETSP1438-20131217/1306_1 /TAXON_ID=1461541 /ORGANISM="Pterosperma sp., Strain CCMP1384" /LENGTH=84 /DNA_ID=CAMNT_0043455047 /DNA_START=252 /DNA_END=506 /DNA_ORIENTATION=-